MRLTINIEKYEQQISKSDNTISRKFEDNNTRSIKDIYVSNLKADISAKLKEKGYEVFALDQKVKEKEEHVYPIQVDVTKIESVQTALKEIEKITKEITAIIHFAGVYMLNSLVEMSESDFKKIMDINLYGVYLMNKTFLPLLNKGSRIIITTSELAVVDPLPFTGIYAISKTALDRYAYSLRMELQLLGIHVSVIRAGAIQTGMLGVSTQALDRFTEETQLYSCNAKRFHQIVDKVEATIGMNTTIGDDSAIIFASQLYSAIGFGQPLDKAYAQAKAMLMLENTKEQNTPELFVKEGFEAKDIIFVK